MNEDEKYESFIKMLISKLSEEGMIPKNFKLVNEGETVRFNDNVLDICEKRSDDALTCYDIYRMGKYLNLSPIDLKSKDYIDIFNNAAFPRFGLKFKNGKCPFCKMDANTLEYKCILPDEAKPLLCTTHPLLPVRVEDNKYIYLNVADKVDESHAVKECTTEELMKEVLRNKITFEEVYTKFIKLIAKEFEPEIFIRVGYAIAMRPEAKEIMIQLKQDLHHIKGATSIEIMQDFIVKTIQSLIAEQYLDYDINKEFFPQLEENFQRASKMVEAALGIIGDLLSQLELKGVTIDEIEKEAEKLNFTIKGEMMDDRR